MQHLQPIKPYFEFTRSQRRGIFLLLAIILAIQCFFLLPEQSVEDNSVEKQQWLAHQRAFDSLKIVAAAEKKTIRPFNPNFITDFKGFMLGMSVAEIDRLHAFRKKDKYVNSAAEFQQVTGVSDSMLAVLSLNFKFPDWVGRNQTRKNFQKFRAAAQSELPVIDINKATAEDLIKIYGIGPALSERILNQREILGGFVSMSQISDVWGLSEEVVGNVRKRFNVAAVPEVKKVAINLASVKELSRFPYFRYPLSKDIVTYRSMNGNIKSAEDLKKIRNFPVDKLDIIAVYLEF